MYLCIEKQIRIAYGKFNDKPSINWKDAERVIQETVNKLDELELTS